MHTFRRVMKADGSEAYRLGYYDPAAKREDWVVIGEVYTLEDAVAWISYLNGGSKPTGPFPQHP